MQPSDAFLERLRDEFPMLRLRWSPARMTWQLEQRVGHGRLPRSRLDLADDQAIRARDGYWFIAEITPGSRFKCPGCGFWLKAPELKVAEVRCEYCRDKGHDGRHWAGFFPFNEALLEHLRKIDPRRVTIDQLAEKCDAANEAMLEERRLKMVDDVGVAAGEDFNIWVGIDSVGYTGKEAMWQMKPNDYSPQPPSRRIETSISL